MTVAADTVASRKLRILVVDDNRDAADTCATLLGFSGHQVQAAYNGESAFELAARFGRRSPCSISACLT